MAILDRTNAETADYFHPSGQSGCAQSVTIGPRGGVKYPRTELWRRNGRTRVWKREPGRYSIPVKFGMYGYYRITDTDTRGYWHTGSAEQCPLGSLFASIAKQGR